MQFRFACAVIRLDEYAAGPAVGDGASESCLERRAAAQDDHGRDLARWMQTCIRIILRRSNFRGFKRHDIHGRLHQQRSQAIKIKDKILSIRPRIHQQRMNAPNLIRLAQHQCILAKGAIFSDFTETRELELMLGGLAGQGRCDLRGDHCDSNVVFDAAGDDDVGEFALGRDVFVVVWFDEGEPLFYAAFDVATAFFYVSDHCVPLAWGGVLIVAVRQARHMVYKRDADLDCEKRLGPTSS